MFDRALVKEGRLGFWRWFLGAWGIGTYRKRRPGRRRLGRPTARPRVAHALDIEPVGSATRAAAQTATAPRQGAISRSALRIARVAGERLSV